MSGEKICARYGFRRLASVRFGRFVRSGRSGRLTRSVLVGGVEWVGSVGLRSIPTQGRTRQGNYARCAPAHRELSEARNNEPTIGGRRMANNR